MNAVVPDNGDQRKLHALLLVLLVVMFALGIYVPPFDQETRHVWVDLIWTFTSLLTGQRCFAAARALDGSARKAWWMFGWGCVAWFGGMLIWDYYELVMGFVTPFPSTADLGFLSFALFFAVGVLFYRPKAPNAPFALMEFSQFGILISCMVAVHIVVMYGPLTDIDQPTSYRAVALAYPILYMALLVHVLASLWLYVRTSGARHIFAFILAGIALHAFAVTLYSYNLLGRGYEVGNYIDVLWVAGFAFIYYAALTEQAVQARAVTWEDDAFPGYLRFGGLLPPVALVITLVVIVAFRQHLRPEMIDLLLPVAACLLLFIGLREWASGEFEHRLNIEVRLSEERLKQMARVAPVGIFRTDAAGNCIYVNDSCSELTGLAPALCYARGWMDALHPDMTANA